jgi:hypothetical protein
VHRGEHGLSYLVQPPLRCLDPLTALTGNLVLSTSGDRELTTWLDRHHHYLGGGKLLMSVIGGRNVN